MNNYAIVSLMRNVTGSLHLTLETVKRLVVIPFHRTTKATKDGGENGLKNVRSIPLYHHQRRSTFLCLRRRHAASSPSGWDRDRASSRCSASPSPRRSPEFLEHHPFCRDRAFAGECVNIAETMKQKIEERVNMLRLFLDVLSKSMEGTPFCVFRWGG